MRYLMVTTAALAMLAGPAFAQELTSEQEMAARGYLEQATTAGSEVIPGEDTENWNVGTDVPAEYEIAMFDGVGGMSDYGYIRGDESYYIVDTDRRIVHMMPLEPATGAGSEVVPPAGQSDKDDVSQPTN